MRPTFLGFETQKRTLMIAQKNQDIVGNNIEKIGALFPNCITEVKKDNGQI